MRPIDADALIKEYEEILKTLADFCVLERMMCREVIRALQNAPTIEPSEQYKKGFEDAKRAFELEYARESENMRKRNAELEVMLNSYREISAEPCKSAEQNVADVPSGDLISREELLKKLDRQIEWEEANAIPYEDADGGCILGLKKARKYVKLASSTEKPNANDCDLISRADALEQMAQAECGLHYEDCEADKCFCSYIQRILDLPSADRPSADVVHKPDYSYEADMVKRLKEATSGDRPKGEWIDREDSTDMFFLYRYECSVCGGKNVFNSSYCPNCGAHMR